MKQLLLLLISMGMYQYTRAGFTVEMEIAGRPATYYEEPIYVTGNFNKWNPGEERYMLKELGHGKLGILLELENIPSDRLEFKFTRGDWKSLECNTRGRLEVPRVLELNKDTLIRVQIEGWRDDFPESTASARVHVLDSAMFIPAFNDVRRIWIYLPEGYESSDKRYPVMYMHDGQQMFDEATSTGRTGPVEWGVDEVIDDALEKYIVVAINHNANKEKRIGEYLVVPNAENPVAQGRQYLSFIVDSLKPLVDSRYRTLKDKSHTTLAGSSMGGLISLYGGLLYPDVFGNLGILSPSIWYDAGNIENMITNHLQNISGIDQQRYFFYAGGSENRKKPDGTFVEMDKDVNRILALFRSKANPRIEILINPNGRHGGTYWRAVFPVFYDWLTGKKK